MANVYFSSSLGDDGSPGDGSADFPYQTAAAHLGSLSSGDVAILLDGDTWSEEWALPDDNIKLTTRFGGYATIDRKDQGDYCVHLNGKNGCEVEHVIGMMANQNSFNMNGSCDGNYFRDCIASYPGGRGFIHESTAVGTNWVIGCEVIHPGADCYSTRQDGEMWVLGSVGYGADLASNTDGATTHDDSRTHTIGCVFFRCTNGLSHTHNSRRVICANTLIFDCAYAVKWSPASYVSSDILAYNNIFIGRPFQENSVSRYAGANYATILAQAGGLYLFNNYIANMGGAVTTSNNTWGLYWENNLDGSQGELHVRNNVFRGNLQTGTSQKGYLFRNRSTLVGSPGWLRASNNAYDYEDLPAASAIYLDDHGGFLTVAQYLALGFEEDAVSGAFNRLGDPSVNKYHAMLDSDSPLVNAGMNLSDWFTGDFDGNPRPASGPWHIGPFQDVLTGRDDPRLGYRNRLRVRNF